MCAQMFCGTAEEMDEVFSRRYAFMKPYEIVKNVMLHGEETGVVYLKNVGGGTNGGLLLFSAGAIARPQPLDVEDYMAEHSTFRC